ncbi:hypothetical protein B0H21DRAFT_443443 [Amylocystis lapponica]|nr:hypothetical protein B0H21DRAFT_443443 [Amylocystis lapponica]
MYSRALQTITFLFFFFFTTLVCASPMPAPAPQPIDQKLAQIIAVNNNLGCSGEQGCVGWNTTTVDALAKSGALARSVPIASGTLAAVFAIAGSLSAAALV